MKSVKKNVHSALTQSKMSPASAKSPTCKVAKATAK